jgi:hypothetical protein
MFFCWPYYLRCSLFGLVATLRFCEGRTRLKSGATMELHRLAQYLAAAYPDNKFLKQKKCKFRKKSFKTWKKMFQRVHTTTFLQMLKQLKAERIFLSGGKTASLIVR